jgi:predicted nucleic acid-binding Zn ribbon protein
MSDDPLAECNLCGGGLKKRMFPVGIVFKGSGFYVNDYANKNNNGSSTTASPPTPETKPETKAEPPKTTPEPAAASPAG